VRTKVNRRGPSPYVSCSRLSLAVVFAGLSVFIGLLADPPCRADDAKRVAEAAKRSTLNQEGTKPFHLKAVITPSNRDRDSGRTGTVEYWWESPTRYRREVACPEFRQIEIVDGSHRWQKNDGSYFPEWLREIAIALVDPIPDLDKVLQHVREAEVKRLMGSTYYSWQWMSSDGKVEKGIGASVAITDQTGLLFYGGDAGWFGSYHDYQSFHGRMVARKVGSATVETLEDLRNVANGFFDAQQAGGDPQPIDTVLVDEVTMRKNLLPASAIQWPPVQDGPLEGVLTTRIVIDREGKIREVGLILSDNPAVAETARSAISAMQFHPYLVNGVPVQVISRITMPFKTQRPAGSESFESAKSYFERGSKAGFPAATGSSPYRLRAQFQAGTSAGVATGEYEDTWFSDSQWRREARVGNSRYVRARNGENWYEFEEGPDSKLLQMVLRFMEPIPALDTFVESDWKIKRDTVAGTKAVRVLTGYESPEGKLDPDAKAYWFDDSGQLLQTYYLGMEIRRSNFQDYSGIKVARQIDVSRNGSLGMQIQVTEMASPTGVDPKLFEISGHKWTRQFTDESR